MIIKPVTDTFIINSYSLTILTKEIPILLNIDRRFLCSGRIHYKITLEVCLQDGQVLSLI